MDLWCYTPYYDRYLCESLAEQDIEVTLGSVSPYEDPAYFSKHGLKNDPGLIDVVPKLGISNQTLRRLLMLIESSLNMVALSARFTLKKPDIVHVQWTPLVRKLPFEIWFLRLLKALKIKLVYTVHNLLPHDTGRKFWPVFKRLYGLMDALICHTYQAKKQLVADFSVDAGKVAVIPHGPLFHDSERPTVKASRGRLSLPQNSILVLWQGIIRTYKGVEFLLDAWKKVAHSGNALLLIAGTGEASLLEDVTRQVSSLGLKDSVRLDLRFIPDEELSAYYQASDILVFPYREVTTSGSFMTALTYRKAMVVTKLPAFQEVLNGVDAALYVDYGDTQGLAEALTRLIREPSERQRLASKARSVSNDAWRLIARDTRACYGNVLGKAVYR
jgi:glycosyltransferase involved in cell wall biosynthesis